MTFVYFNTDNIRSISVYLFIPTRPLYSDNQGESLTDPGIGSIAPGPVSSSIKICRVCDDFNIRHYMCKIQAFVSLVF